MQVTGEWFNIISSFRHHSPSFNRSFLPRHLSHLPIAFSLCLLSALWPSMQRARWRREKRSTVIRERTEVRRTSKAKRTEQTERERNEAAGVDRRTQRKKSPRRALQDSEQRVEDTDRSRSRFTAKEREKEKEERRVEETLDRMKIVWGGGGKSASSVRFKNRQGEMRFE